MVCQITKQTGDNCGIRYDYKKDFQQQKLPIEKT